MKNLPRTMIGAAAAALLVTTSVSAAHAADASVMEARIWASLGVSAAAAALYSGDGTFADLVRLNAGASEAELRDETTSVAAELGLTPQAVLRQQLIEARESAAAAKAAEQVVGIAASSSGGGSATVTLGNATRKGDIFVSPASTLFVQHGHTGIYYLTTTIVDAPGSGKTSRSALANNIRVGKGAVKQYVGTTQADRDKAANYAYDNMRGKPYNANFADNRKAPAKSYNCSQLVWGAYKVTTKVDLDSNGGLGVYPYNIKDSKLTVTYKTL